jgi:hypothetical protein
MRHVRVNIVQSGIRQTFLRTFSNNQGLKMIGQTLQTLDEQIIPCTPNLSDSV